MYCNRNHFTCSTWVSSICSLKKVWGMNVNLMQEELPFCGIIPPISWPENWFGLLRPIETGRPMLLNTVSLIVNYLTLAAYGSIQLLAATHPFVIWRKSGYFLCNLLLVYFSHFVFFDNSSLLFSSFLSCVCTEHTQL